MASERELNLLIRARDEASRVIRQNERAFHDLERSMEDVGRVASSSIGRIPDELRPVHSELDRAGREFRELGRTAGTVDELADSLQRTRIGAGALTSVSRSGREAIEVIQDLAGSTREAELAALGLSRNGDIRLTTDEAQEALNRYQGELRETRERLEELRDAGNFGAYTAGMMQLEQSTRRVNRAMAAAAQGGMAYYTTLQRLGIYSSNTADHMAIAMEGYRDRFIQSIDMMTQRSTQGEKIQKNFERLGRPLLGVTRYLNNISSELERTARAGMPAALALQELGPSASMRDLLDMITQINQGIMRFQMLSMVAGVALAAFTYVMAQAARGPDVAETLQKQQDALAEYTEALQTRTQEIYDAWSLFEKAQIEKTKPETLLKNLEQQVNIMATWSRNLASLAKKGVDEGLIAELRKMGPAAAGEIAALNQMSGPQLDQYVELWRSKHKLAKDAAITELAGLKEETKKKIAELQDSLKPLGVSFENFKSTWAEALKPFVELWGYLASKVVDAGTAIGNFVNKLNEINPNITALAGMFLFLFTAVTLLLAPLAVGISAAGSFAAAFTALWAIIGPVVTGFLAVAGYAAVIAAALVALGVVVYQLWKNSEDFRNALINGWNAIKKTVMDAIAPIVPALIGLKDTFIKTVSDWVGGSGTMSSIFAALGDKIAVVINFIVAVILPILTFALKLLVTIVLGVIENIKNIITSGVAIIQNVWQLFANLLKGNWSAAWENVKTILYNAVIFLWNLIQLWFVGKMFASIGAFASSVKTLISGFWTGIRTAFSRSLTVLQTGLSTSWSIMVSVIRTAIQTIGNIFTAGWNGYLNLIKTILQAMWTAITSSFATIKNAVTTLISGIRTAFSGLDLSAIGRNIMQGLLNGITGMASAIWDKAKSIADGVKNTIKDALNINSPSRVMMDLGKWTSVGLADGIEKYARLATNAAGSMAQGVINPVQGMSTNVAGPSYAPAAASSGGSRGAAPVYVTFEKGAFEGAFPGVRKAEEIQKAVKGISLKAAFNAQ